MTSTPMNLSDPAVSSTPTVDREASVSPPSSPSTPGEDVPPLARFAPSEDDLKPLLSRHEPSMQQEANHDPRSFFDGPSSQPSRVNPVQPTNDATIIPMTSSTPTTSSQGLPHPTLDIPSPSPSMAPEDKVERDDLNRLMHSERSNDPGVSDHYGTTLNDPLLQTTAASSSPSSRMSPEDKVEDDTLNQFMHSERPSDLSVPSGLGASSSLDASSGLGASNHHGTTSDDPLLQAMTTSSYPSSRMASEDKMKGDALNQSMYSERPSGLGASSGLGTSNHHGTTSDDPLLQAKTASSYPSSHHMGSPRSSSSPTLSDNVPLGTLIPEGTKPSILLGKPSTSSPPVTQGQSDHLLKDEETQSPLPILKDTSDHLLQNPQDLQEKSPSVSSMETHGRSISPKEHERLNPSPLLTHPPSHKDMASDHNPSSTTQKDYTSGSSSSSPPSKPATTAKLVKGKVIKDLGKILNKDGLCHKGEAQMNQAYKEREERNNA